MIYLKMIIITNKNKGILDMRNKTETMNTYINAWLECESPFISVCSKNNHEPLIYFNSEQVTKLIESGDVCIKELQSNNQDVQMELLKDLFAIKADEQFKQQLTTMNQGLRNHKKKVTDNDTSHISRLKQKIALHVAT